MIACLGGWCTKREQCPHHMTEDRRHPVERLCLRGQDGSRMVDVSAGRRVVVDVIRGDWRPAVQAGDSCPA